MQTLKVRVAHEGLKLHRKEIELDGKLVHTQFVNLVPTTKKDLDLLCKVSSFSTENTDYTNCLKAITYRIFEHDEVTRIRESRVNDNTYQIDHYNNQIDRYGKDLDQAYRYIKRATLKLIDPATDIYRNRRKTYLDRYSRLDPPDFLKSYLKRFQRVESNELGAEHYRLWLNMFQKKGGGRRKEFQDIGRFIKWHEKAQEIRGKSISLPATPFIDYKFKEFLIEKAIEINEDWPEYSLGDVAIYFNLSSEVFKDMDSILKILSYIDQNKNNGRRFIVFKISDTFELISGKYGKRAIKNLEFFLKEIRETELIEIDGGKPRIFGLLNGGGFGYCLLGTGFDFFTDYISNYEYYIPTRTRTRSQRKYLDDESLILEDFDSLVQGVAYGEEVPLPYHPQQKYHNFRNFNRRTVDIDEWGNDCKINGMCLWNKLVQELIDGTDDNNRFDSLFFDRVFNSAFTKLAPIIRRVD